MGGSVHYMSNFGSGHDFTVCGFKPCIWLCADSLEPGGCFRSCVSLSVCPSPTHKYLSNINIKKNFF